MEDLSKLLEIATASKKESKSSKRIYESKSVDHFVKDFNIQSGTAEVENEVLFYYYRMVFSPEFNRSKVNKDMFFKVMHGLFPSLRKGHQRYFLLQDGVFNINDEIIKKAKEYDKTHWQKKRQKNKKERVKSTEKMGAVANRRDFIEAEYINGVRDEHGNEVMRALTDLEVEWLNNWYKEEVHAKFENNDETKSETKKLKILRLRHKQFAQDNGFDHPEVVAQKERVIGLKTKIGNMITDPDEQSRIYADNYARNQCIFNLAKANGTLWNFDWNESGIDSDDLEVQNVVNELENFGEDE